MPLLKRLTALAGAAAAAKNYARRHPDKVDRWATKAAQFVDRRTNGKYRSKIDGAVRRVRATTQGRPPGR